MNDAPRPADRPLVTVAHGSRNPDGNEVARAITAQVAALWDGPVIGAYVELCEPVFAAALTDGAPAVVVPLLFSAGTHVCHDLPDRAAPGTLFAPSLGPDPVLAQVQAQRLRAAGAMPGEPVTMVATGSLQDAAQDDLERARALLADAWGATVRLSTMTGQGRRPADVVRPGDVVSPYLLAPGHFTRLLTQQSLDAGARVVADVLGPDPAIAALVVDRARGELGSRPCERLGRCDGPVGCRTPG